MGRKASVPNQPYTQTFEAASICAVTADHCWVWKSDLMRCAGGRGVGTGECPQAESWGGWVLASPSFLKGTIPQNGALCGGVLFLTLVQETDKALRQRLGAPQWSLELTMFTTLELCHCGICLASGHSCHCSPGSGQLGQVLVDVWNRQ